ncbi:MAG TPA: VWA domain-containing protein [Bryobacteraceae bacterium]|jgi:VWFA-related protein|nr:VWA domain-containing protein [Bryobacteraceae bacterium]
MAIFRIYLCLLLWTVAIPDPAAAEQDAPRKPSGAENRITLDVVAKDKSGKLAPNLQEEDFTILDNKRPRRIVSFEAVSGATASGPPMQIVLVVDAVNTTFAKVAYDRSELDKFLKRDGGRLSRPLSMAFVTDSGLKMGAPSRDGAALQEYLDQHVTGLRAVTRSQGFYGAVDRLRLSLDALNRIAQNLGSQPGRKLVVWISPGWPLLSGPRMQLTSKQEQQIFQNVVGLSTELRESGITLYAVDPLGTSDTAGTFYYQEFLKGVKSWKQAVFGNLALQVIATHSGGRALNSNNDIAGEVESCIRDADDYYVVSFDPQPADSPDDYHQIEVKLSGHDLKAQTLSAYYAQPQSR